MGLLRETLALAAIQVHKCGIQNSGRLGGGVDTVQSHGTGRLEREVQADLVVYILIVEVIRERWGSWSAWARIMTEDGVKITHTGEQRGATRAKGSS